MHVLTTGLPSIQELVEKVILLVYRKSELIRKIQNKYSLSVGLISFVNITGKGTNYRVTFCEQISKFQENLSCCKQSSCCLSIQKVFYPQEDLTYILFWYFFQILFKGF
jgi:F0F1-type ATP synthase beta subunit